MKVNDPSHFRNYYGPPSPARIVRLRASKVSQIIPQDPYSFDGHALSVYIDGKEVNKVRPGKDDPWYCLKHNCHNHPFERHGIFEKAREQKEER